MVSCFPQLSPAACCRIAVPESTVAPQVGNKAGSCGGPLGHHIAEGASGPMPQQPNVIGSTKAGGWHSASSYLVCEVQATRLVLELESQCPGVPSSRQQEVHYITFG